MFEDQPSSSHTHIYPKGSDERAFAGNIKDTTAAEEAVLNDTFQEMDAILGRILLVHRSREILDLITKFQELNKLCKAKFKHVSRADTYIKAWEKLYLCSFERIADILQSFEESQSIQNILFDAGFMTGDFGQFKFPYWDRRRSSS
ncbi:hypothetical protein MMC18_003252 [Xylographa bjoerkii]|nr:hypothetical protein [Xylographa bjoerkii]